MPTSNSTQESYENLYDFFLTLKNAIYKYREHLSYSFHDDIGSQGHAEVAPLLFKLAELKENEEIYNRLMEMTKNTYFDMFDKIFTELLFIHEGTCLQHYFDTLANILYSHEKDLKEIKYPASNVQPMTSAPILVNMSEREQLLNKIQTNSLDQNESFLKLIDQLKNIIAKQRNNKIKFLFNFIYEINSESAEKGRHIIGQLNIITFLPTKRLNDWVLILKLFEKYHLNNQEPIEKLT